jgi:gamma-glutamyltranspeptidase/glutathione hydrolase
MQPAINLAKNGFILTSQDTDFLDLKTNAFKTNANVAAIFLNNGNPFSPGQRLVQKNLAKTLETIATEKANAFYHGKIAKEILKASQQNGGLLTLKDFAKYTIEEQKPLICHYRGYKIITVPPPGSGATVCEILNITEDYPLQKLGLHSALATHYIIEAMRYSYADRNTYLADPDFVKIPLTKLLSQQHAETIRQRISPNYLFLIKKKKIPHPTRLLINMAMWLWLLIP